MNENVRRAMIEAIENTPVEYFKFNKIAKCKFDVVEKFIANHRLGITISDVLGYCDMAVFGAGKKGHIIAKTFLYYSPDGKAGKKILFEGMKSVKSEKGKLYVEYGNGNTKNFTTSTYAYASYYEALLNAYINAVNSESEDKPPKPIVEPVVEQPQIVKQEVKDENTVAKQKEIEEQLKAIAEAKMAAEAKKMQVPVQPKAEVKEDPKVKYAHEYKIACPSEEFFRLIEKDLNAFMKSNHSFCPIRSSELFYIEERSTIKKALPFLNMDHVIAYSYTSSKFKKEWYVFTPFDYYDSYKNHVSLVNIVKCEAIAKGKYGLDTVRIRYKDGFVKDYKLWVPACYAPEIINKIIGSGSLIWNRARQYEKSGALEKAYHLYLEGALLLNNSDCQNNLGIMYNTGKYVKKDIERVLYWYGQAANNGLVCAQSNLGAVYYIEKQYEKAVYWAKKAADQGYASAINTLGRCYMSGKGVKYDIKEAIRLFEIASEKGNCYADYSLGTVYTYRVVNYKKAFKYYQKAAERSFDAAWNSMGLAYYYGRGVVIDYKKALECFDKAIEINNNSVAYAYKAYYYLEIEHDIKEAMHYYNKAIELGWKSYNMIAEIYTDEKYGMQDYAKAIEWYEKGVAENHSYSMIELGQMYMEGKGVERDTNKAFELFQKAYGNGEPRAAAILSEMYRTGNGVEENKVKAAQLAIEAGNSSDSYMKYSTGCYYMEDKYNKNATFGMLYLTDVAKKKGDKYGKLAREKIVEYMADPKYNLAEELSRTMYDSALESVDFDHKIISARLVFQKYYEIDSQGERCPARAYALLAKNYQYGYNGEIDYEKAVEYYEKCLHAGDYRYDSEIEFEYAALRFEGLGCEQDFYYGFKMAIAVDAGYLNGLCEPYLEGRARFVELVSKYLKESIGFQYVWDAAKYVSPEDVRYQELTRISLAEEGKKLYEEALRLEEKLATSIGYEKEKAEYEVVNYLLKAADRGYWQAIEYAVRKYSESVNSWIPDTELNYNLKLTYYHTDSGLLDYASYMSWGNGDYYGAILHLRELVVARDADDLNHKRAKEFVFGTLTSCNQVVLDDIYLEKLRDIYYSREAEYKGNYKEKLRTILGLDVADGAKEYKRFVYLNFTIQKTGAFLSDLGNTYGSFWKKYKSNSARSSLFVVKKNRIYNPDFSNLNDSGCLELEEGDSVKIKFWGRDSIVNDAIFMIIEFARKGYLADLNHLNSNFENCGLAVGRFVKKIGKEYVFEHNYTKHLISVRPEQVAYMPSYFKKDEEAFIVLADEEKPMVVFKVDSNEKYL